MTTPLDGFSVARIIADWLDGKQCEDAHRQVDRAEKLWKESQGDKANDEPRQYSARRSTSHPSDTRTDPERVGSPIGDVDPLGSILGGSGNPPDAQVAGRGSVRVLEDLEEERFEEGGEGLMTQDHAPPLIGDAHPDPPVGNWSRKIWGLTREVFSSPDVSVNTLKVRAGYHCSRHYHHGKDNRFIVQSGLIAVAEWDPTGTGDPTMHLLHPGDVHDVYGGNWHMFLCYEDAIMSEIYFRTGSDIVEHADIVRDRSCLGGKIPGWH